MKVLNSFKSSKWSKSSRFKRTIRDFAAINKACFLVFQFRSNWMLKCRLTASLINSSVWLQLTATFSNVLVNSSYYFEMRAAAFNWANEAACWDSQFKSSILDDSIKLLNWIIQKQASNVFQWVGHLPLLLQISNLPNFQWNRESIMSFIWV